MSDSLKLENQLCHRFYLLSNAFTRAYRPVLSSLGITYPQYVVLMALWEKDAITIASLTQKTRIDAGAMTQILKKLKDKDILEIKKSDVDKRVKYVHLTSNGKELKEAAKTIPDQMLCKLNGFEIDEVRQLMKLLDKLDTCFDADQC